MQYFQANLFFGMSNLSAKYMWLSADMWSDHSGASIIIFIFSINALVVFIPAGAFVVSLK